MKADKLEARYYKWHDDGILTPGIGFFRNKRIIAHMNEVEALNLAHQIIDQIEKQRKRRKKR